MPRAMWREIRFYSLTAGDLATPIPIDRVRDALTEIRNRPFTDRDDGGRYLAHGSGHLCAWPDRVEPPRPHLRFALTRLTDLPQLEEAGDLSALNIPEASGLYEAVHIVIFDDGVLGADFNFYAPRPTSLARYLQAVAPASAPSVAISPLIRSDLAAQLREMKELRMFSLRIHPSAIGVVQEANASLARAFQAAHTASNGEQLEFVVRPAKYARRGLSPQLLETTRVLAQNPDLLAGAQHFEIRGTFGHEGQEVRTVDVLSTIVTASRHIVSMDQRSRALDPTSAYAAIEGAHDELRDELASAHPVS